MRNGLIYDLRDYIVAAQTFGYSVNWEHGLDEAIDFNPNTGTMSVSEAFADHACDLTSWSFSRGFVDVFPELRGRYRVVEQEKIPVSDVDVDEFLRQRGKKRVKSR